MRGCVACFIKFLTELSLKKDNDFLHNGIILKNMFYSILQMSHWICKNTLLPCLILLMFKAIFIDHHNHIRKPSFESQSLELGFSRKLPPLNIEFFLLSLGFCDLKIDRESTLSTDSFLCQEILHLAKSQKTMSKLLSREHRIFIKWVRLHLISWVIMLKGSLQ